MGFDVKKGAFCLLAAAVLLSAGCSGVLLNGRPSSVRAANSRPDTREKYRIQSISPSFVTVKKGDTVYSLSRRYNVPTRALIETNRLSPPFLLNKGQRIKLPPASIHTVQKGDTIYSISRRYNVDMSLLARQNGLKAPYDIYPGQFLKLPGSIVEQKETKVASANKASSAKSPAKKTAAPARKISGRKSSVRLPAPPTRSSGRFAWPADGPVMTKFGPAGAGRHNDGINIKVAEGTFVRASENGVVAYAGNELKGFGNLLLVKHSDGWMTAYAHNKEFLVKRGETVKRGQPMARAGKSGNAKEPQLHFEIRKGTKAVDPLAYLERK